MQIIGFLTLFAAGVVTVTGLSVSVYAALPKSLLAYAEAHGRFQGLPDGVKITNGTRAGSPPVERPLVLDHQSV